MPSMAYQTNRAHTTPLRSPPTKACPSPGPVRFLREGGNFGKAATVPAYRPPYIELEWYYPYIYSGPGLSKFDTQSYTYVRTYVQCHAVLLQLHTSLALPESYVRSISAIPGTVPRVPLLASANFIRYMELSENIKYIKGEARQVRT